MHPLSQADRTEVKGSRSTPHGHAPSLSHWLEAPDPWPERFTNSHIPQNFSRALRDTHSPPLKLCDRYISLSSFISRSVACTEPDTAPCPGEDTRALETRRAAWQVRWTRPGSDTPQPTRRKRLAPRQTCQGLPPPPSQHPPAPAHFSRRKHVRLSNLASGSS